MQYLDYLRLGKNVKAAREAAGLTKEDLAQAINVDPLYIKLLESGGFGFGGGTLYQIAAVLQVSSDTLKGLLEAPEGQD